MSENAIQIKTPWAPKSADYRAPATLSLPVPAGLRELQGWFGRFGTAILIGCGIAVVALVSAALGGAIVWTPAFTLMSLMVLGAATAKTLLGGAREAILVLGDGDDALQVIAAVRSTTRPAFALRSLVRRSASVRRVGSWTEAVQVASLGICTELVYAGSAFAPAAPLVDGTGRKAMILTGVEAIQRRKGLVPLDLIGQDLWFRQLGSVRVMERAHATFKRTLDLLMSTCLGVVLIPFLPLVALAIKLESPGPILYSQMRVGLGGRLFRIYKFRSMRQDAEREGAKWAQVGDSRVTRVGRFMRLTRIDELPQLWNVARGEMTLVGPRPERPEFTVMLEKELPAYANRYAMKPGLTGWAQVRFSYTSSIADTARKLEYDLYYLKHASIALDLRILLETFRVVARKAGC